MTNEEEWLESLTERAEAVLADHPEIDAFLCGRVADAYAEIGHEPSDEDIRVLVLAFTIEIMSAQQVLIDEQFTDERIEKIIDEELERCMDPSTRAAPLEDVEKAVFARMTSIMRKAYPNRFPPE